MITYFKQNARKLKTQLHDIWSEHNKRQSAHTATRKKQWTLCKEQWGEIRAEISQYVSSRLRSFPSKMKQFAMGALLFPILLPLCFFLTLRTIMKNFARNPLLAIILIHLLFVGGITIIVVVFIFFAMILAGLDALGIIQLN